MYEKIGKKLKEKYKEKIREAYSMEKAEDPEIMLPKGEAPDFSKAIKRLRQTARFSLEKLSELTGINKQTLHSIENYSIRNPSFTNLEKIAVALKISLQDLLLMARGEFVGNFFKTTVAERWTANFEVEKGFSIHVYSPPGVSQRDFFVGVMTLQPGKRLRYWKFKSNAKVCLQPWEGDILFIYHGMNWRKEEKVSVSETLYFDASIPHTIENISERQNRVLLLSCPSIF